MEIREEREGVLREYLHYYCTNLSVLAQFSEVAFLGGYLKV